LQLALSFLRPYSHGDVLKLHFAAPSQVPWSISRRARRALVAQLRNCSAPLQIRFQLDVARCAARPGGAVRSHNLLRRPLASGARWQSLRNRSELDTDSRAALAAAIESGEGPALTVPRALPHHVWVPAAGMVSAPDGAHRGWTVGATQVEVARVLERANAPRRDSALRLQLREDCWLVGEEGVALTAFVDKVFPAVFEWVTARG